MEVKEVSRSCEFVGFIHLDQRSMCLLDYRGKRMAKKGTFTKLVIFHFSIKPEKINAKQIS